MYVHCTLHSSADAVNVVKVKLRERSVELTVYNTAHFYPSYTLFCIFCFVLTITYHLSCNKFGLLLEGTKDYFIQAVGSV